MDSAGVDLTTFEHATLARVDVLRAARPDLSVADAAAVAASAALLAHAHAAEMMEQARVVADIDRQATADLEMWAKEQRAQHAGQTQIDEGMRERRSMAITAFTLARATLDGAAAETWRTRLALVRRAKGIDPHDLAPFKLVHVGHGAARGEGWQLSAGYVVRSRDMARWYRGAPLDAVQALADIEEAFADDIAWIQQQEANRGTH